MTFEITLTAKTSDEGGLVGSFDAQLAELGGEATLISETPPERVNTGDNFHFQATRTYSITL